MVKKESNLQKELKVDIPDEAISYIVSRYLRKKTTNSSSIVMGIPGDAVEDVLSLFLDWAEENNYIKNGILIMGGTPIGG